MTVAETHGHRDSADRWVALMAFVYAFVLLSLSLARHASFGTGLDLAIYDHYVWNYAVGDFARNSIIGATQDWNYYFSPLLIIAVPLYALWSNAVTLLVLQTLALAGSVFPIYWYARSQLGSTLAVIVAASFLLYPALEFVNLSQFHVISLTIPLASLAVYFLLRHRDKPFLVCAFLLLLVKEEALFVVLGLGLYVLLVQRRYALGFSVCFVAALWFVVLINYLFPMLTGRSYFVARGHLFGQLGGSVPDMLRTMIDNPGLLWQLVLSPPNLQLLWILLLPLALLPLAGFELLLLSIPYLGMTILTQTHWIASQYPAGLVPGMYFAAIVGLRRILNTRASRWLAFFKRGRAYVPGFALLIFSFLGVVFLGPAGGIGHEYWGRDPFGVNFPFSILSLWGLGSGSSTYTEWTVLIPPGAFVVAQEEALPHFSARKDIVAFSPHLEYRQADYAVGRRGLFFYDFHKPTWEAWWSSGYFRFLFDKDGYFVAKRKEPSFPLEVRFGALKLLGYTIWPEPPLVGGTVLKPILSWQAGEPISEEYSFRLQLVDSLGHVWAGQTTNASTPTTRWEPHKTVGDQYSLNLSPLMPSGEYQVVVEVHQADGGYLESFDSQGGSLGTGLVLAAIQVQKSNQAVNAAQLEMGNRLYVDLPDLRFLGYELNGQRFAPGDLVQLGLYWKARVHPGQDNFISVQLRDLEHHIVFEQSSRPALGSYPTTQWTAGEGLLDWHDFTVPSSINLGTYKLFVVLKNAEDGTDLGQVQLSDITIGDE